MENLNPLIELAFGTTTKLRILTTLHQWQESFLSERQLAELCGISTYGLRHALADLERIFLLSKQRVGRAHIWSYNKKSFAYEQLAPIIEKNATTQSPLDYIINKFIQELPTQSIDWFTIFGSVIEKPFYKASDIDICIVLATPSNLSILEKNRTVVGKATSEIATQLRQSLGKHIDVYILDHAEWEKLKKKPLGKAILKSKEIHPHEEI